MLGTPEATLEALELLVRRNPPSIPPNFLFLNNNIFYFQEDTQIDHATWHLDWQSVGALAGLHRTNASGEGHGFTQEVNK